jgi:hypothetical protein
MIQSTFFAGVLVVISGISAGVRSKRERAGWCDIAPQMTIEQAAGRGGVNVWIALFLAIERRSMLAR